MVDRCHVCQEFRRNPAPATVKDSLEAIAQEMAEQNLCRLYRVCEESQSAEESLIDFQTFTRRMIDKIRELANAL